jgi:hypothetical protein
MQVQVMRRLVELDGHAVSRDLVAIQAHEKLAPKN